MWMPELRQHEVNHIQVSIDRCSADEIASELGRAKTTIQSKLDEMKEHDRIQKLSHYAKYEKHKVRRKIKGGM